MLLSSAPRFILAACSIVCTRCSAMYVFPSYPFSIFCISIGLFMFFFNEMCRVLLILKVDADAIHCFLSTLYHIDSESLLPDSESLSREGCTIFPVVSMLTFPLISDAAALRPVFLYCRLTRSRRSLSVNKHGPSIASTYSLKKTQIICCIFFHTHLLSSVFLEYYL